MLKTATSPSSALDIFFVLGSTGGAIAGGVVGAVLIIAVVVGIVVYFRR